MPSGKRLLLAAVVASLVLTAAIAIGILLFGEFDDTQARILGTTGFLSVASLLSLPGAALLDRGRLPTLAAATLALAAAAFAASMVALWGDSETAWKLTGSLAAAAVAATQTAGLASRLRGDDPASVRRLFALATALVAATAAMAVYAIWGGADDETYARVMAALAVANVLAVVLQPVLRRGRAAPAAHRLLITLDDGSATEVEARGDDFADAAARAIRGAERGGRRVRAVERVRS